MRGYNCVVTRARKVGFLFVVSLNISELTYFNAFIGLMLKEKKFASFLSYYLLFFLIDLYCNSLIYQPSVGSTMNST